MTMYTAKKNPMLCVSMADSVRSASGMFLGALL